MKWFELAWLLKRLAIAALALAVGLVVVDAINGACEDVAAEIQAATTTTIN